MINQVSKRAVMVIYTLTSASVSIVTEIVPNMLDDDIEDENQKNEGHRGNQF